MSPLPIELRQQARQDFADAFDHYIAEDAPDAAFRLTKALDLAYAVITEHPAIGSRRHGEKLGIDGLRTWPVDGFPFLVFYAEQRDQVEVWRVLHVRRDIPAAFDDRS